MGASPVGLSDSRTGGIRARLCAMAAVALAALAALAPASAEAALDVPQQVADINPGPGGSSVLTATPLGRFVLFRATDGSSGIELWRSDGTAAGTVRVADINPGAASSSPGVITRNGNTVLFAAVDGNGDELWQSDGTTAGTSRIYDINPGAASSSPRDLLPYPGGVFFRATEAATGNEPWLTDGTLFGTNPLGDINPGAASSTGGFFSAALTGGRILFTANEPVAGSELWRVVLPDGDPELVANIALAGGSAPRTLTPSGAWTYFTADDNIVGRELWRSDGQPGGTYELVDDLDGAATDSGVTGLTAHAGRVYFQGPAPGNGVELMRTTLPGPGTEIVADVNPVGDSDPQSLTPTDGGLFFTAVTAGSGRELWLTDGVPGGTTDLVEDIDPGASGSVCPTPYLTELNGEVFFCAGDGTNGNELWRSDGTPGGTEMVGDINPAGSSNPASLSVHGDTLYFVAEDGGAGGRELYALDTAPPDTALIDSPGAGEHIADPTPALRLDSDAIDLIRFQCSSGSGFSNCGGLNGLATPGPLPDGPVDLRARAVDTRNNVDPTPVVVPSFTIDTTAPRVAREGPQGPREGASSQAQDPLRSDRAHRPLQREVRARDPQEGPRWEQAQEAPAGQGHGRARSGRQGSGKAASQAQGSPGACEHAESSQGEAEDRGRGRARQRAPDGQAGQGPPAPPLIAADLGKEKARDLSRAFPKWSPQKRSPYIMPPMSGMPPPIGAVLLGRLGDDALRRQDVLGDRGRVLQRRARDHGRVDDAVLDQVAVLAGARVETLAGLHVAHLVDDDRALEPGVLARSDGSAPRAPGG